MKKFSDWLMVLLGSSLCLGAMPVAGGKSIGGFAAEKTMFGEPAKGLQLGIYLNKGDEFDPGSFFGYIALKNSGSNDVFLSAGGPKYANLVASSPAGAQVAFLDATDLSIFLADGFIQSPPFVLRPGMVSALRFNLSKKLRATSPGRYFLMVSTKLIMSETIPPRKDTLDEFELFSGSIEFAMPDTLIVSETNWPPSSAVAMPFAAHFIDTSTARTPEEKELIQQANESTTNFIRQRWPHLLGEAPLTSDDTNKAISAPVSLPIAEVETGGTAASRWWIAGAAVAATAAAGLAVLRRARNRSRG